MAQRVRLTSGLYATRLNEKEQNVIWNEVMTDVNPVGKHSLYTPDGLEYFIKSETELAYDKYEAVIIANGKTVKVKYGICNSDEKTMNAVRKAFGK